MPVDTIKSMVETPHPVYVNNVRFWNFLIESYEGGIDYSESGLKSTTDRSSSNIFQVKVGGKLLRERTSSNLFQHKRELNKDFDRRQDMSYYYNFCAPIIDIYTNHLFKQPVNADFSSIENAVEMRHNNVDRMGSSLIEFRKQVADLAQIYGHIFVVTDSPRVNFDIFSMQDRIDNDVFPYFTIFHPQKVINWSLDRFGKPHWVLLCEASDANPDPNMFDGRKKSVINYRLWTRDEWFLYDGEFNLIEEGMHGLGRVPITCVFDRPSKKVRNFLGISSIADISLIARNVYNLTSYLQEIIRNQTFSLLTLQGESAEYDDITVGTNRALIYPNDRQQPNFISPPEGPAQIIMEQIDQEVHKMFQLAKLEGGSAAQVNQVTSQSGVSKAFDFQETNSALSKKADNLEDGEIKLWQNFAAWEGQEFDGRIDYPDEFSVQDLNEDLEEAEQLFKLNLGQKFNLEIKKDIIRKKLPRAAEDDINEMIEELENQSQGNGSLLNRIPALNRGTQNGGRNGRRDERDEARANAGNTAGS